MGAIGNVTANDAAQRQHMSQLQVRLSLLEDSSQALRDRLAKQDGSFAQFQKDMSTLGERQASLTPKAILSHPSVQHLLDQKVFLFFLQFDATRLIEKQNKRWRNDCSSRKRMAW